MASQQFKSTRGGGLLTFREALMSGYASDGGLIMPASIPLVDRATLELWRPLGFAGVAAAVLGLFIAEAEVPRDTLVGLLARACARFDVPEVIPVVAVPRATEGAAPMFIAEMWHGPTLAFKDIGMQVIGGLLDHFLRASGKHVSLVVRGWRACVAPPPRVMCCFAGGHERRHRERCH